MVLTPTLTLLELVNTIAALFGLVVCFYGWGVAQRDLHELEGAIPSLRGRARLSQALTNLRVQQSLSGMCLGFLAVCAISDSTPGGPMFSLTPAGGTLLILTGINVLVGVTSFMIQRGRWIVLSFREANDEPAGVA